MSKESREIEKSNPDYEVGKKRKIVFWSLIASGIGVIVAIALLLIFLLPKDNKFEIDLGSNVSVEDGTLTGEGSYKKGDSVTIVAEDIDGYRFTGWSYGGNIISTDKEYTFQINEENEGEYTANYAKIYSVSTFDNNQYGSFTVAPIEAIAGETVTVRYEVNSENQDKYQLKRLYYVIAGDLQGTQTTIENNTFTMPEGNVTIYAEFNNLYNINLTTNIEEEITLDGQGTYLEKDTVTITAPNVEGYRFRNWTYNGNPVTIEQEYKIANIDSTTSGTYIANYDRLYSITINSSNGTVTIVDNKTTAIENENIEFTVKPNSDYRLIEVKVNNKTLTEQDGKYSFAMPAENVTIVVTYIQQLEVILQSDMENADLSGADIYDIGSEVTITASTYIEDQEGNQYRLIGWQHNEEFIPAEEGGIYTFALTAETAGIYTAIYEMGYTITVDENSSEYIQIDKLVGYKDDTITFTATIEDEVTDTQVIEKALKITKADGQEIEFTQDGNQYSFTMPESNITIYVDGETYRRLDDFEFEGNSITGYTGSATELTLPAYYDTVTVNSQDYTVEKDTGTHVTSIGDYAFAGCSNLTSITLPSSLTSIGKCAFAGCSNLTSIALPSSLTFIGSSAFISCNNLTSITIPEGVTSIGSSAFGYCSNLTSIALPSSLTSIGNEAFFYCSSLTEITIPEGVTSIGEDAFRGCSGLTEIYYEGTLDQWLEISFRGSWSAGDNLYFNNDLADEITINKDIPAYAFYNIDSLTKVTIGEGVTSIDDYAFGSCNKLTTVVIESDDIYKAANGTNQNQAGYLLQYATTIKVLTSIVNSCDNSYLENTSNFTTSIEGEYTVFTYKVN